MQTLQEETKVNGKTPLYHTFKYKDKAYLFDVRTGISMRIDDMAHEVLKLYDQYTKEEIIDKLKDRYSPEQLEEVFFGFAYLGNQGLFRRQREETFEEINSHIQRIIKRQSCAIQLAVVEGCNMRCGYCYEKDCLPRAEKKLMTKEVGERVIEFLIEKSKGGNELNVTFFGGEPLLNWPLIKHLVHYVEKRAKELGRSTFFSLTTNGTLVTKEVAWYIKKYNFGLMCSLDGPPEVQNKVRPMENGQGSFFKAARGIKRIMRIRRQVTVRATTNRLNNDCEELHKFFERFGFTRFAIGAAMGKSYKKGPLDFGPDDVDELIQRADKEVEVSLERLKEGKPLYRNPFLVIKEIHDRTHTRIRCGVGKGVTIASVEGKLYPCHRYLGMENYCLGDIWGGYDESKLYDYLWDYYKVKEYCKPCWLVHLCGGPCPWHVAHEDGHHRPPDKNFQCRLVTSAFERAIWLYEEVKENFPDYFNKLTNPKEE